MKFSTLLSLEMSSTRKTAKMSGGVLQVIALLLLHIANADIYSKCGNDTGCFGMPEDCVQSKSCRAIVSFIGISENAYHFEMEAKTDQNSDMYAAIGLNEDKAMGQAVVVACTSFKGSSNVAMYWNSAQKSNSILGNSTLAISKTNVTMQDGSLQCSFDMHAKYQVEDPQDASNKLNLDLNNHPYHILLAIGTPVSATQLNYHSSRTVSNEPFDLSEYNDHHQGNDDIYAKCGNDMGCYGLPDNCVQNKTCQTVITFIGISDTAYHFEMEAQTTQDSDQYAAFGLNVDKSMGQAVVVACTTFKGSSNVAMYWNSAQKTNSILGNSTLAISNTSISMKDGSMKCRFDMMAKYQVEDPQNTTNKLDLDLNEKSYHILLATGTPVSATQLNYHSSRIVSNEALDLSDYNDHHQVNDDIYAKCGNETGCFGMPENCIESKSCQALVSFIGISENGYYFELVAQIGNNSDQYAAFGLNEVKAMGQAVVVACTIFNGSSNVAMYWNSAQKTNSILGNSTLAISKTNVTIKDGSMKCAFDMLANFQVEDPKDASNKLNLDLNKNPYHLLLATGTPISNTQLNYHTSRIVSDKSLDLSDYNDHHHDGSDIYSKCGKETGCFGMPEDCVKDKSCQTVVSFLGISENEYRFEMEAKTGKSSNQYTAVGLNTDKAMGPAVVVACTSFQGSSNAAMYWNSAQKSNSILGNSTLAISNTNVSMQDGSMKCSFDMLAKYQVEDPQDATNKLEYDLNNQPYHLLLAIGTPVSATQLNYHSSRIVSTNSINLSDTSQDKIDIYAGCGTDKGCFGSEENCVYNKNCTMVTRFYGVSNASYSIEIFGTLANNSQYIASALSFDKLMGNDSVMACILNETSGLPSVQMYWNDKQGSSQPLQDTSFGITNITGKFINNQLYCHFVRDALTDISSPLDNTETSFDLNSDPFFILMASGPLNQSLIGYHGNSRVASNDSFVFSSFNRFLDKTYEDCLNGKQGCFGSPSDCIQSRNCLMLSTFVQDPSSKDVLFNLHLSTAQEKSYIAIALSDDKFMGDDSVMMCYIPPLLTENSTGVAMAWNFGPPGRKTSGVLADPSEGLKSGMKSELKDGVLTCSFERRRETLINIPDNSTKTKSFDLTQKFYLMLATGQMKEYSGSSIGMQMMHHTSRDVTADQVDFSDHSIISGKAPILVTIHGSLMSIAWILFASTGTLMARYGKDFNTNIHGKLLWFRIHQFCMSMTWMLTIIGVVVIFIERKTDPLQPSQILTNPHGLIGLISSILAFIQPFMAILRPEPKSPKRRLFNYTHFTFGMTAMLLAMTAIILTNWLASLKLDTNGLLIVSIVFAGLYFAVHILSTLSQLTIRKEMRNRALAALLFLSTLSSLALSVTIVFYIVQATK